VKYDLGLFCGEKTEKNGSPSPKPWPKSRFSAKNPKKMALRARNHGQRVVFLRKTQRKWLSEPEIKAKEPFFSEKPEENGFPSSKSRLKSRFSAKNLKKAALRAQNHG